jgi:hypothetical protein
MEFKFYHRNNKRALLWSSRVEFPYSQPILILSSTYVYFDLSIDLLAQDFQTKSCTCSFSLYTCYMTCLLNSSWFHLPNNNGWRARIMKLLFAMALMMVTVSTSETSVNFYQTTRRNIPEDSHLHIRRRKVFKSHLETNFTPTSLWAMNECLEARSVFQNFLNSSFHLLLGITMWVWKFKEPILNSVDMLLPVCPN